MNKADVKKKPPRAKNGEQRKLTDVKYQESPIERALKLSSEQVIAAAIRDLIKKDDLN